MIAADPSFDATEYINLICLLYDVNQSLKGNQVQDGRLVDCEAFVLKMIFHSGSAHKLYQLTDIPKMANGQAKFYDPASVIVIARSVFETYLLFFYLFVEPAIPSDEFEFRYCAWELEGLIWRQKMPTRSTETIKKLLSENSQISSLRATLKQNPIFCNKKPKQQELILKGRSWRDPWSDLGKRSGIGPLYSQLIYAYMSQHAHAGRIGLLQLIQAQDAQEQIDLTETGLQVITIAVSKMILDYSHLFPDINPVLEANLDVFKQAQIWSEAAKRLK